MEVVVLTVDQDGSREGTDQVPAALEALAAVATRLPFERTVGDEFQGVLDDPAALVARSRAAAARRRLEHRYRHRRRRDAAPRPGARGPRSGVPRGARGRDRREGEPVARAGGGRRGFRQRRADGVRALESAVWLWAALLGRRTTRGWEVADLVDQGLTYDQTASRARHHPVGGQPAGSRGRHRRGTPRTRAGGVPDPHHTRRCPMTQEVVITGLVSLAALLSVVGLATGKAARVVTGALRGPAAARAPPRLVVGRRPRPRQGASPWWRRSSRSPVVGS